MYGIERINNSLVPRSDNNKQLETMGSQETKLIYHVAVAPELIACNEDYVIMVLL